VDPRSYCLLRDGQERKPKKSRRFHKLFGGCVTRSQQVTPTHNAVKISAQPFSSGRCVGFLMHAALEESWPARYCHTHDDAGSEVVNVLRRGAGIGCWLLLGCRCMHATAMELDPGSNGLVVGAEPSERQTRVARRPARTTPNPFGRVDCAGSTFFCWWTAAASQLKQRNGASPLVPAGLFVVPAPRPSSSGRVSVPQPPKSKR